MGLTYHDAVAETGVHEKALARLSPEQLLQRNRRLKRAFDLSQKHAELPPHMQENAFREFEKVQAVFAQTQKDHDERAAINDGEGGKPRARPPASAAAETAAAETAAPNARSATALSPPQSGGCPTTSART